MTALCDAGADVNTRLYYKYPEYEEYISMSIIGHAIFSSRSAHDHIKALSEYNPDPNDRQIHFCRYQGYKETYNLSTMGLAMHKKVSLDVQKALAQRKPNPNDRQKYSTNHGSNEENWDLSTMGLACVNNS